MKSPGFSDRLVLTLSSALGLGYLPKAPGTWGTLMGIPLWWALSGLSWWAYAVATAGMIGVAIAVAERADQIYGEHDRGEIVIDEVVGLMVTAIGIPLSWPSVVAAFVLFRFFDIVKPPPVRWIDEKLGGGAGVVLDDVAAGLYALAVMHAVSWILAAMSIAPLW